MVRQAYDFRHCRFLIDDGLVCLQQREREVESSYILSVLNESPMLKVKKEIVSRACSQFSSEGIRGACDHIVLGVNLGVDG